MSEGSRRSTVRLPHGAIVKAPGMLPMMYTTRELADDLGVAARTVREWATRGMPHERDRRGHIWVNGREFAEWVDATRRAADGDGMAPDEGYCMRCNARVRMAEPVVYRGGVSTLLQSACPHCGATVSRGVRDGEPEQLPGG